jgi:hypothetical protein
MAAQQQYQAQITLATVRAHCFDLIFLSPVDHSTSSDIKDGQTALQPCNTLRQGRNLCSLYWIHASHTDLRFLGNPLLWLIHSKFRLKKHL